MKIVSRREIEKTLDMPAIIEAVERGFVLHHRGETVIPPHGSLLFESGECHIKYGYVHGGRYYVVKIASNFPHNPSRGLPTGNGMMILFDQETGAPVALFEDEGLLTELRTAAAGAIAAKYLAPKHISCVGIVGTGAQAFYQASLTPYTVDCKNFMIWGRDRKKAEALAARLPFSAQIASSLGQLCEVCNLIVTTTSARSPLLFPEQIREGTHITAIGADEAGKIELAPSLVEKADIVVTDDLGQVIVDPTRGRTTSTQITIAKLTGIAIQDLQIALCALKNLLP